MEDNKEIIIEETEEIQTNFVEVSIDELNEDGEVENVYKENE